LLFSLGRSFNVKILVWVQANWHFIETSILCGLAIAFSVVLLQMLGDMKKQIAQKELEKEIERSKLIESQKAKIELEQQSLQMEMQALRAQMNPHFLFNALSSINRFILRNDGKQASEFLSKFSMLVRMILQNSQETMITLESELEALGLYLELEALRFNYHFKYDIMVQEELDASILKVPPLIIQPFAENAIWHGLMHKEEMGHLKIDVFEEGEYLYIKIADDGIGRDEARRIAKRATNKHKSMGMNITSRRIAIVQKEGDDEPGITINDLVNADGAPAGTEVIIKIPAIYD
jgi:LytS/YehU family sensor histidine kinase